MQPLGGHQGEAVAQVKAHLVAENRQSTHPGAVGLFDALGQNAADQVMIVLHGYGLVIARHDLVAVVGQINNPSAD